MEPKFNLRFWLYFVAYAGIVSLGVNVFWRESLSFNLPGVTLMVMICSLFLLLDIDGDKDFTAPATRNQAPEHEPAQPPEQEGT